METIAPIKKKGRPKGAVKKEQLCLYLSPQASLALRREALKNRMSLSEVVERRITHCACPSDS